MEMAGRCREGCVGDMYVIEMVTEGSRLRRIHVHNHGDQGSQRAVEIRSVVVSKPLHSFSASFLRGGGGEMHFKWNVWFGNSCFEGTTHWCLAELFFLGGRRGTCTPKHFVNLTGKTTNFKMLEFPLNQPQTFYSLCDLCPLAAFIFSDLNHKMEIFLSQNIYLE
jgi:hypothetical protein